MKVTKLFVAMFAAVAAVATTSCLSSNEGESANESVAGVSYSEVMEQIEKTGSIAIPSATTTTAGAPKATVTIPAAAMEGAKGVENEVFGVDVTESTQVVGEEAKKVVNVSLYPPTAEFSKPVNVEVSVDAADGEVYEYVDQNGKVQTATVKNGKVTLQVTSFKNPVILTPKATGHSGGSAQ